MLNLVEAIFSLLLASEGRELSADARDRLLRSPEETWQGALDALSVHKVFPLLSHRLAQHALSAELPPSPTTRVRELHEEVRTRNALLLLTLARLLRLAQQKGEELLLLKGILFADSYYPEFSTRPMSDLDLVAAPGHADELFKLLDEAGFRPSLHHTVQEHSVTFMNREGVFCDAHRSLPMFAREPWHSLTRPLELTHVRGVKARELEPNAMVAHLAAHMFGHAREMGFVLLWIVDLALVLRRFGGELTAVRLRQLLAHDGAWALLLRLCKLIESAGGEVPPELARRARAVPPLTLSAVLRQRRLTPWGIPAPLGWARLAAHTLGLHRSERPLPSRADLLLWPLDELTACAAPPLARVALR